MSNGSTNALLQLGRDVQALALLGTNIKESKKKKPDLTKLAAKNIAGTSLIRAQAQIAGDL